VSSGFLKFIKNIKLRGNEFQSVGVAWQKAGLSNTVLAAATWSRPKWCSLERRCRGVVRNWSKSWRMEIHGSAPG